MPTGLKPIKTEEDSTRAMLENLQAKISQKPHTSKNDTRASSTGRITPSVWSRVNCEIAHDDQNRTENIFKKMDRKRIVEQEHRYNRAKVPENFLLNPFTVTESDLNNPEGSVRFPWEKREAAHGDFRDLIARKPNAQDRYEMLI